MCKYRCHKFSCKRDAKRCGEQTHWSHVSDASGLCNITHTGLLASDTINRTAFLYFAISSHHSHTHTHTNDMTKHIQHESNAGATFLFFFSFYKERNRSAMLDSTRSMGNTKGLRYTWTRGTNALLHFILFPLKKNLICCVRYWLREWVLLGHTAHFSRRRQEGKDVWLSWNPIILYLKRLHVMKGQNETAGEVRKVKRQHFLLQAAALKRNNFNATMCGEKHRINCRVFILFFFLSWALIDSWFYMTRVCSSSTAELQNQRVYNTTVKQNLGHKYI